MSCFRTVLQIHYAILKQDGLCELFQARNSHRQLCSEHEHLQFEIETNKIRLETLRSDADSLRDVSFNVLCC